MISRCLKQIPLSFCQTTDSYQKLMEFARPILSPKKQLWDIPISIVNTLHGALPKYKLQYKPGVRDALVHMWFFLLPALLCSYKESNNKN